jgi:hypothetical protein
MSPVVLASPEEMALSATQRVLEVVFQDGEPLVVVRSPPGAGKTWLVETVVAVATRHFGLRVAVLAPRAEQTYDLLRRLAGVVAPVPIQPLQSSLRSLPADLEGDPRILPPTPNVAGVAVQARVLVGNVAKFFDSCPDFPQARFDLLVCDEAYQVPFKDFAPLFKLARQVLMVGDPGQLPPLVRADTAPFESGLVKVHWPAPRELLRKFTGVPVVSLPVTRRLPQDTVDILQPAFYPDLEFVSSAVPEERRISFGATGLRTPVDRALDLLEEGATLVGLLLPRLEYPVGEVDQEVVETMAEVVRRLRERQVLMGGEALSDAMIGCTDPHVISNAALGRAVRGMGAHDVVCDTPEQWQGLQRPLMVVRHPLSGSRRLDAFSLDPGRACVMLSRHQGACIIVGRDSIGDALDAHLHNCGDRPMQADDAEWRGWSAHQRVWQAMEEQGRWVRI